MYRTSFVAVAALQIPLLLSNCLVQRYMERGRNMTFPEGAYDVSIGGPGELMYTFTVPVASLCEFPSRRDFVDWCVGGDDALPFAHLFIAVDHVWLDVISVSFDGTPFDPASELHIRLVGPSGDLAAATLTQIPSDPEVRVHLRRNKRIDLLDSNLSSCNCLRIEFTLTGRNPLENIPVHTYMWLRVEHHMRGLIDPNLLPQS